MVEYPPQGNKKTQHGSLRIVFFYLVVFLVESCVSFVPTCKSTMVSSLLFASKSKKEDSDDNKQQEDQRNIALDGIMNQIERSYGRGSIMKFGKYNKKDMQLECISTGSLTLDIALGGKGYPKGRVIEIFGPESSGKTTLALHAIAEAQKERSNDDGSPNNGIGAFIDVEHALDPNYAQAIGVNVEDLLISQPDCGEMALDIVDQLIRSAAVNIIVVDSVAALVPRAELEGDMSDMQIGLQARLMSKALRKITSSLASSNSKCTVLFLNQLRQKVGVIYGNPEVTSGGNALKFYASIRLDCRRKEILPDNRGIKIKVKVVKNKISNPFKIIDLDIIFGKGIDSISCLIDSAEYLSILDRKGSWYSYSGATNDENNNKNLAQGRNNLIALLKKDTQLRNQIELDVKNKLQQQQDAEDEDEGEQKVVHDNNDGLVFENQGLQQQGQGIADEEEVNKSILE